MALLRAALQYLSNLLDKYNKNRLSRYTDIDSVVSNTRHPILNFTILYERNTFRLTTLEYVQLVTMVTVASPRPELSNARVQYRRQSKSKFSSNRLHDSEMRSATATAVTGIQSLTAESYSSNLSTFLRYQPCSDLYANFNRKPPSQAINLNSTSVAAHLEAKTSERKAVLVLI